MVKKIQWLGFVYVHSREGPSWPLWVKFLEVKAVDGVTEACPVRFRQDVCPLLEAMFDDVGSFLQGFELSWLEGLFCNIIVDD